MEYISCSLALLSALEEVAAREALVTSRKPLPLNVILSIVRFIPRLNSEEKSLWKLQDISIVFTESYSSSLSLPFENSVKIRRAGRQKGRTGAGLARRPPDVTSTLHEILKLCLGSSAKRVKIQK
ncbi:hypothetical protein EVAR_84654_1 [Eumeta japonica]|uniref:Uncharacterized protein n=1 Tax=Eumeta variegata TaxID=151549 RepID=A0A4C1V012_EUMVA|nr:hypothetical protein EVAR_84654_1 [Eumeta japonica]